MNDQRALRRAQEAIERRGEWEKLPAFRGLRPGRLMDDWIMPLLLLGSIALAVSAWMGWLDGAGRWMFGFNG